MKRWQDLAPPDDPDSFYDIDGFWPTSRGGYETADFLTGTDRTVTVTGSATAPIYAFASLNVTAVKNEFVIASGFGSAIWQTNDGVTFTNVTGTASAIAPVNNGGLQMVQFGDITLLATRSKGTFKFSTAGDTAFSNWTNPIGCALLCVQSNVVLGFKQVANQDGWQASDVGDYTNFSTGEAASGRIYQLPGPITAAVPFGNDVVVFKANSIYRMTYVGGLVKWSVNLIWTGNGCGTEKGACANAQGILYCGVTQSDTGSPATPWYFFDGVNPPVLTNPMTSIPASDSIIWNPLKEIFTVWAAGVPYYFSPKNMAWGKNSTAIGDSTFIPVVGDFSGHIELSSTTSGYTASSTAGKLKRYATAGGDTGKVGTCYIQTSKIGDSDNKYTFQRVVPQLRRKSDLGSGTTALVVQTYRERWDNSVQASVNATVSTYRDRYDLDGQSGVTDNFARFKHTWTNYDVEVDDLAVTKVSVGPD